MFTTLPERFKAFHLKVDVRTLLLLQKAIDRELVKTIGDLYNVLRTFIVKSPELMGPYTRAFYDYFLSIDIRNGEQLHDAVLRSQTFQQWKEQNAGRLEEDMSRKEMANLFLDEVHITHYDIQKVIDATPNHFIMELIPIRPLDIVVRFRIIFIGFSILTTTNRNNGCQ